MKLSKNLRQEIGIHLSFVAGAWVLAPFLYFAYRWGWLEPAPAEFVICLGLFLEICLYVWFRQGLTADKTQFKPRIW